MAATFLHDSLAVGVAGSRAPYADDLATLAASWGAPTGRGCSRLGGRRGALSAGGAAFINAYQIHGQEFDCVHEPAVVHPLATCLAALLAEAERSGPYDGARFLTALVVGVDVAAGLGLAAKSPLTFFRPATAGVFGSVAALVSLKGLSSGEGVAAFGYALAFASGTMQAHLEGLPTLPVQIAAAARSALEAVEIAELGMPGPVGSIDGPFGYLSLFEQASDLGPVLADLASCRRIVEVSWKPFPTGRAAHGAIVATKALVSDHGLRAEDLLRLVYRAPPLIRRLVGRPAGPNMTVASARLCFPYLGAATLLRGGVGLTDFTPARLADPAVLDLAARIDVLEDGNSDPAAFTPAYAQAETCGGRTLRVDVAAQLGSPHWPLTRRQHLDKAKACLTFADLQGAAPALEDLVSSFPAVKDAGASIMELLAR